MPRRKSRMKSQIKKKKAIQKRLMEISFLVDDYVYNNRIVSSEEAKKYITEVISFKDACFSDARCLQVIEKLYNCMKGIISEQSETEILSEDVRDNLKQSANINTSTFEVGKENSSQSVFISNNTQFPVYSTPKENAVAATECLDMSVITNNLDENNVINTENNYFTTIPEKSKENVTINTNTGVDINIDAENINEKNKEVDIERAIYNLSVTDTEEMFASVGCSQSILGNMVNEDVHLNYYNIPSLNTEINVTNVDTLTESQLIIEKDLTKDSLTGIQSPVINKTNENIIIPNQKCSKNVMSKITNNTSLPVITTNTTNENSKTKSNTTVSFLFSENPATEINKITEKQVVKEKKKRGNSRSTPKTKANPKKTTAKTKKKPTVKSQAIDTNINNLDKRSQNIVENDLSWVENIRYVREVADDEYIPNIFEDIFWESNTLPGKWPEEEFCYTNN